MGLFSSQRIVLVLAFPVILLAGAVFVTANVQRSLAARGAHEQQVSESVLVAMLNQETGSRGYFQTGQTLFLQPWREGTSDFSSSLSELRSLVSGESGLERSLAEQAQRARNWHDVTAAAIVTLERTGHPQSIAAARSGKSLMDGFRAAHTSFDVSLAQQRGNRQFDATSISVAVVVVLAALLAGGALLLTRRMARAEQVRQEDQTELRELMQAAESQPESHALLIRHVEKLIPGAAAAVLNRDAHEDRLEITFGGDDSRLRSVNTERMRASSCLAVRLSHGYDHRPGDRRLKECEICGQLEGVTTCEPLLFGGQAIGAVLVGSSSAIDAEDRARLRESVAQAAPILANQDNLATAETLAASDALTGLPNRRVADEALERMAAQAARLVSPLAAIMLDLDHFKEVNDQHGHASGDRALTGVGRIIASALRASDFAARFGGEEFLILLPDTDREAAVVVAEKLRTEIERAEFVGVGSISASLGLAVLPFDAVEPLELLRRADRALYAAKESGRNCVHVFSSADIEVGAALRGKVRRSDASPNGEQERQTPPARAPTSAAK